MFISSELLLYWAPTCSLTSPLTLLCKAEFIVDNGDDDGAGLKPTLPRWRSLDEVSGVAGVGVPLVLTGICGGDDNELLTAGLLTDVKVVKEGLLGLDTLTVVEMALELSVELAPLDSETFD